jgi:hypothetical protein
MIIGTICPAVQRFHRKFLAKLDGMGVWAGLVLPILLHGLLLAVQRRTMKTLGAATLVHRICAGNVCHWLARLGLPLDGWYEKVFAQLLEAAARLDPEGDWVLIFDGTDTKRGGLAKIQNTRRYKKEKKKKKGRPSMVSNWRRESSGVIVCVAARRLRRRIVVRNRVGRGRTKTGLMKYTASAARFRVWAKRRWCTPGRRLSTHRDREWTSVNLLPW